MVGRSKIVGKEGKPLKSELHHWWPRGLSQLWTDAEGKVNRLSWNGEILARPPAKFGAITNAHHVKLSGPWAGTVESLFNDADNHLPRMARQLELLSYYEAPVDRTFESRLTPHTLDQLERQRLGEGLASLLVRCPAHRNLLHLTTESFLQRTGDNVRKHDGTLIALNINQHYAQVVDSLKSGGKIVVLRSVENEFVFGEGYLSTLVGHGIELTYRCLLPLTPNMAILAFASRQYKRLPSICTIGVTPQEVNLINEVTQVYSRDYIFFRRVAPRIIDQFKVRKFLSLEFHNFPWLENLMQSVANYVPE